MKNLRFSAEFNVFLGCRVSLDINVPAEWGLPEDWRNKAWLGFTIIDLLLSQERDQRKDLEPACVSGKIPQVKIFYGKIACMNVFPITKGNDLGCLLGSRAYRQLYILVRPVNKNAGKITALWLAKILVTYFQSFLFIFLTHTPLGAPLFLLYVLFLGTNLSMKFCWNSTIILHLGRRCWACRKLWRQSDYERWTVRVLVCGAALVTNQALPKILTWKPKFLTRLYR